MTLGAASGWWRAGRGGAGRGWCSGEEAALIALTTGPAIAVEFFEERNDDPARRSQEWAKFAGGGLRVAPEMLDDAFAGPLKCGRGEHDVHREFEDFAGLQETPQGFLRDRIGGELLDQGMVRKDSAAGTTWEGAH